MEKKDIELIEKYMDRDVELKKYVEQHGDLEKKLEDEERKEFGGRIFSAAELQEFRQKNLFL